MSHSIALDIGTYAIKVVQGQFGRTLKVEKTIEVENPTGASLSTDEAMTEKLVDVVGGLFQEHKLPTADVRLSLPEQFVSTKIISIPVLSDAELASAITWQAEQHIPIPPDELSLEYQVIYRPDRRDKNAQMRVLMVGVRKSVIEKFLDVFYRLGLEPTTLETHVLSIFRAMQFTSEDPTTLIVHWGANTTDLVVVHQGELRFVYTQNTGGQVLTKSIEQSLQLEPKQAEQYKRTYGLDQYQLQGKIRENLLPVLKLQVLEMQKAIQFFASQESGESVKRVLLSGGSAQLPGLTQFMSEQLGVEVLVASPFGGAEGEIPEANHPAYTVCAGVLMRKNK